MCRAFFCFDRQMPGCSHLAKRVVAGNYPELPFLKLRKADYLASVYLRATSSQLTTLKNAAT